MPVRYTCFTAACNVLVQTVNCHSVIEELYATLRTLAEAENLNFEVSFPEQERLIRTDCRSLVQILINLANSAIKFTDKGTVHIDLHACHDDRGLLAAIAVADTGIGIRQEGQAKTGWWWPRAALRRHLMIHGSRFDRELRQALTHGKRKQKTSQRRSNVCRRRQSYTCPSDFRYLTVSISCV
jgi:light-regulated signal transduction histidine kinase (bacteriophytochrome)